MKKKKRTNYKTLAPREWPRIPEKRYFTISEVSVLCAVKAYVLRYWEQEFSVLRPLKRLGNRRYYQHQDIVLIRRIRKLLYEDGFTIEGARTQLLQGVETSPMIESTQSATARTWQNKLTDVVQGLEKIVSDLSDLKAL